MAAVLGVVNWACAPEIGYTLMHLLREQNGLSESKTKQPVKHTKLKTYIRKENEWSENGVNWT